MFIFLFKVILNTLCLFVFFKNNNKYLKLDKERNFRMKGIKMLHEFIKNERKYDTDIIKEAFDDIYDLEEENNYKILCRKFASDDYKFPY